MRIVAALLALGVIAAACGNDDGGGNENASSEDDREQVEANDSDGNRDTSSDEGRAYAQAIAASSEDDLAGDFSEEDGLCVGFAFVDAIGVDQLVAAGTPGELFNDPDATLTDMGISFGDEQADALWDGLNDCVDARQFFFNMLRAEEEMPEEAIACLERELSDDFLKRTLVTTMVEGEEALDNDEQLLSEMFDALATCPEAAALDQ